MKPTIIVAICVICAATLMSGCMEEYTHHTVVDKTLHLNPGGVYYYGGNGEVANSSHTFRYDISSTRPVNVRIIPSMHDFEMASSGLTYTHYPDLLSNDVYRVTDTVTIAEHGGVMVINDNFDSTKLSVKIEYVI